MLQQAVGPRRTVVASAIARLHLASPDPKALKRNEPGSVLRTFRNLSDDQWTFSNVVGALVYVIDRACDTFVFQIYDLQQYQLRFEYELYYDLEYSMLSAQFHCFEMEDACAGFCFADAQEARVFLSKVMALKPSTKSTAAGNLLKGAGGEEQKKAKGGWKLFGGGGKKGAAAAAESDDDDGIQIGEIKMVQHNQHVGVKADGTFDMANLPPQWKQMFKEAGIRKKDLQDPETAAQIMRTIQQQETQNGLAQMYAQDPQYEGVAAETIEAAVQDFSPEELQAYEQYQEDLRKYYAELEAYENEQKALAAWERDNAQRVEAEQRRMREEQERQEQQQRANGGSSAASPKKAAPALPARKKQEAVKLAEEDVKVTQYKLKETENKMRMTFKQADKTKDQKEAQRMRDKAKAEAEAARQAALAAAEERDRLLAELEEDIPPPPPSPHPDQGANGSSSPGKKLSMRLSSPFRRTSQRANGSAAPPVPAPIPRPLSMAPPPPPPPLPAPIAQPKPPPLPAIPGLSLNALKDGKSALKKAPEKEKERTPQDTLRTQIKKGAQLKAAAPQAAAPPAGGIGPSKGAGALPDLGVLQPRQQNQLMAKLVETMNQRRVVVGGDNEEDNDDWD